MIIGVVLILLAGIVAYRILANAQKNETIMVPNQNLPAYSFVDGSDLTATSVPANSVTTDDLTQTYFNDNLKGQFVITSPILQNQRVDKRDIAATGSSFAVVLPDERVVAVNSTITGAAVGTIQAGDVVDVAGSSGDTSSSTFDKVLCIGSSAAACQGILPPGVNISVDSTSSSGNVTVLLAVPQMDAPQIAGQSVNLSLNPFCQIDSQGYFVSPRGNEGRQFKCQAPADRLASHPPANNAAQATNDNSSTTPTQAGQ